jgi:threonine synthase
MPYASDLVLRALKETQGMAVAVDDERILSSMRILFSKGLFVCPEAAAALAGMHELQKRDVFNPHEKVLLYLTGNGMVYSNIPTVDRTNIPILEKDADSVRINS